MHEIPVSSRYRSLRHLGSAFEAPSVASAYAKRAPYPEQAFARLLALVPDAARRVLDAGCGPGKLARPLAPHVDAVDAVDPSRAMIAAGRALPGGEHPRIRWLTARIEDAPLRGPYGLIVAGASAHWFDLDVALPRLAPHLHPDGRLALLDGDGAYEPPWQAEEVDLYATLGERRTGTRPDLRRRGPHPPRILEHPYFVHEATVWLEPFRFEQSIDDYVECQRSRSSLSRETLGPELSKVLERELRALLARHAADGRIAFDVRFALEQGALRRA